MKYNTIDIGGTAAPDWRSLADAFYGASPRARHILIEHSRVVAALALEINRRRDLGLDPRQVEYAAMVHDIGIYATHAPGIDCHGTLPYICHGIAGAQALRRAGAPEWAARVAERHTGAGLTPQDITEQNLPLPLTVTMVPETTLEKLICYADKFYSKNPAKLTVPRTTEQVRKDMGAHGTDTLSRFEQLHNEFSIK